MLYKSRLCVTLTLHMLFEVEQERAAAMKHSWKYGNYSLSAHERLSRRAEVVKASNLRPNWEVGP